MSTVTGHRTMTPIVYVNATLNTQSKSMFILTNSSISIAIKLSAGGFPDIFNIMRHCPSPTLQTQW